MATAMTRVATSPARPAPPEESAERACAVAGPRAGGDGARPLPAKRPSEAERPGERLGYVDSLRLIAAGLVLLQHLAERGGGWLARFVLAPGPGVAGVVLFFLISGYVIPFSVRSGLAWRQFAVRRLLRIYPLYLAVLGLLAMVGASGLVEQWAGVQRLEAGAWIANVLLVQDFLGQPAILGVSWTLPLELGWYALFAVGLIALGERAAPVLAAAVPAGLIAMALLSLALGLRIPLGRPGLIHAAVLGWQACRLRSGALSARAFAWNAAAFMGVTWLTAIVSFGHFAHARISLSQVLGPWTFATLLFLAVVLFGPFRSARVLATGWLPRLGAASFSLYLLHPLAIACSAQYAGRAFVPVALVATAGLAMAGWRLIERPGITLAKRLTARSGADRARLA